MNSHKVDYKWIAPYYIFGALSFIAASIFLFPLSSDEFHFAHPLVIASVHCITLGWATMLIFGSGHQLLPVLFNTQLGSRLLMKANFFLAASGIPLLIAGLGKFDMNTYTITGAAAMTLSALCFTANTIITALKARYGKIQALFLGTGAIYLSLTCILGSLQVINLRFFILPFDSFRSLNIHSHAGLIGFLSMFIVGVSSRLIPMFSLSKYENRKTLLLIYITLQSGLIAYILGDLGFKVFDMIYPTGFATSAILFIYHTIRTLKVRFRRQIDTPLKSSFRFHSLLIPMIIFSLISGSFIEDPNTVKLVYGCTWLFGAISGILIGMSFKTLPFMSWSTRGSAGGKALPKDLYREDTFRITNLLQTAGFMTLITGLTGGSAAILYFAKSLLLASSFMYTFMIIKIHLYSTGYGNQ